MQKMIFGFFFQSVLICPISTHFEKKIVHIDRYCVKGLWCCFPIPSLIFIYSMMGLLMYKYEPLWQEVSVKCLILRWPLRPVGLLFFFLRRIIIIYNWWIIWSLMRHWVEIPIKLLKQRLAMVMLTNYIPGRVGVIIMRRLMKTPLSQRYGSPFRTYKKIILNSL